MRRVVAPGRVNLIGDHTDYTGGFALPMAIDRATVIEFETGGEHIELDSHDLPGHVSLPLPAQLDPTMQPEWGRYVAAVAEGLAPKHGIVGRISTTIPVGGGLSSSAALEVAVALALDAEHDPSSLAALCQRAENRATGVPTGIMDQLCILSATEGHATLIDCTDLSVQQVPLPDEVGVVVRFVAPRTLAGSEYGERVRQCRMAEDSVGPLRGAHLDAVEHIRDPVVRARARHVVSENERVRACAAALQRGDWVGAGTAMTASHHSLASDCAVSTPAVDAAVRESLATPGVFGARITGGGFGGCIVTLCRPGTDLPGWRVTPSTAAHRSR